MKNQFVGDADDYGKLGLLRYLAERGVKVGVNWYLTPDLSDADKGGIYYFALARMRECDPELFDGLFHIVEADRRCVESIDELALVPRATYFAERVPMSDRPAERERLRAEWFGRSLECLAEVDLILCDPDTGMLPDGRSVRQKGSEAYVTPAEVAAYFEQGHDVVYSCQKGRRKWSAWEEMKVQMRGHLPDAEIVGITYNQGKDRTYVFVLHRKSYGRYCKMLSSLEWSKWHSDLKRELIGGRYPGAEQEGEAFVFETSKGEVITITRNANGEICLKSSMEPTSTRVLTADGFAKMLFFRW